MVEDDSLGRRAISGGLWVAAQSWIVRVATLLSMIVLARLLTPEDFGIVALASSFVAILSGVATLGLSPTLIQHPVNSPIRLSTAFWCAILSGLALAGLVNILALPVAEVFNEPELESMLRLLSIALPIASFAVVPTALLSRALKMRSLAVRQVIGTLVGVVVGVALAFAGFGAWALVAQTLVTSLVGAVVLWLATDWRPTFHFSVSDFRSLMRSGLPTLGTQLVQQVRDRGDELIVGAILGAGPLGYWVIANRLSRVVADLLTTVINSVSLPVLSRVTDDPVRFARAAQFAISSLAFIVAPVMLGLAFVSPELVPLMFGDQWTMSGTIAQVTTVGMAFLALSWLDSNLWWSRGKYLTELWLTTALAAFHVIVVILAAPFGLYVLALALLVRYVVTVPIRIYALVRWGGIPLSTYKYVWRTALCAAFMIAVMASTAALLPVSTTWAWVLVQACFAVAAYAALSVLLQRHIASRLWAQFRRLRGAR